MLIKSINKGYYDIAKTLVELGIDVNQENYWGWTPLYISVVKNNKFLVKLLVSHGARIPNFKTKDIDDTEVLNILKGSKIVDNGITKIKEFLEILENRLNFNANKVEDIMLIQESLTPFFDKIYINLNGVNDQETCDI